MSARPVPGTVGAEDTRPDAKKVDTRMLARIWEYVRPHRRWLLAGTLCLLAASACRLLLPWLMKIGIDRHVAPGVLEGAGLLVALFVVVAGAEVVLRRGQLVAVDIAGQEALLGLRLAVFRRMQAFPARFHDRTPTGRLVGRVTTDVEALQELFSSGLVTIFGDLVFLTATLAILFALDWRLALATLAVVPLLVLVTMFVRVRARAAYQEMRRRLSQMNAYLHERIAGMVVLQMFRQEAAAAGRYAGINDGVRDAQLRTVWWESMLSAAVEMIGSFAIAVILWSGGDLAALDGDPLTLGVLFAFIDYMQKFFQPLNDLSLKFTVLQNAGTAARRIFELMDETDRTEEPAEPGPLPEPCGAIRFEDVRFGYGGEQVLKGVSFNVECGERVALVGATGAGKTTVLKLLTRLYDPQHGRILLDGVDVRDYPVKELRRRIGVVPQDVFLFDADVLDNVRLGKTDITREDARQAADRLHLGDMVARFPRGYEERVQERGRNLSSGERQLVSFARALAAAPCVLALDEATSSVDSHTEHLLQEAVHEVMEGRTSLAVAHRLSTVRDVDRILVFHHGEVVEEGSHDELVAADGRYARLVRLQFGAGSGSDADSGGTVDTP
jgi:ATP-binding cassette subfamily B protein